MSVPNAAHCSRRCVRLSIRVRMSGQKTSDDHQHPVRSLPTDEPRTAAAKEDLESDLSAVHASHRGRLDTA